MLYTCFTVAQSHWEHIPFVSATHGLKIYYFMFMELQDLVLESDPVFRYLGAFSELLTLALFSSHL